MAAERVSCASDRLVSTSQARWASARTPTAVSASVRPAAEPLEAHLPKRPDLLFGRQRVPVGGGFPLPLGMTRWLLGCGRMQSTRYESWPSRQQSEGL